MLPLWTVLWLGRAHLATCVDPLPILQQQRKQQARWRIGIAAASAVLQLAFLRYYATAPQFHTHVLVLLLVFALDAASVVLLSHADAQLTWPQVALAAVETPLLTSVFSVLYAHVRRSQSSGGVAVAQQLKDAFVCERTACCGCDSASSSSTTASRLHWWL